MICLSLCTAFIQGKTFLHLPALLEVLGPLKPFLISFSPMASDCGTATLTYCSPLFSVASKTLVPVSSLLQVRQDRNQSLGQLPHEPECWMCGPIFCLHPMGGSLVWEISSHLLLEMLHKGRNMCSHTEHCKFSHPFYWSLSWLYSGQSAIASQLNSGVLTEVFQSFLLLTCLYGVRRACSILVCHPDDILSCLFLRARKTFLKSCNRLLLIPHCPDLPHGPTSSPS